MRRFCGGIIIIFGMFVVICISAYEININPVLIPSQDITDHYICLLLFLILILSISIGSGLALIVTPDDGGEYNEI